MEGSRAADRNPQELNRLLCSSCCKTSLPVGRQYLADTMHEGGELNVGKVLPTYVVLSDVTNASTISLPHARFAGRVFLRRRQLNDVEIAGHMLDQQLVRVAVEHRPAALFQYGRQLRVILRRA